MERRRFLITGTLLVNAPLRAAATEGEVLSLDGQWTDAARGDRAVPWRAYVPVAGEGLPWVVYSHGLGGSRLAGEHWGRHWAGQGVASLHLQHAGSDRAVFTRGGIDALRGAMTVAQLHERVRDVRLALDEVSRRAARGEAPWARLDPARVGMAGHSFGAVTTQALAGQRAGPDYAASPLHEPRLRAALAFSPSARRTDPARAFGQVALPFLSITGTRDHTPVAPDVDPAQRLLPHAGLPAGRKYLMVFDGAGHASFGGSREGRLLDDTPAATERIRPLVQQLSSWFWLAHLRGDAPALQRLRQPPLPLALAPGDRYEAG